MTETLSQALEDAWPTVVHSYQNHLLDSTRWHHYRPREGDIVIATSYKSGTTWMQAIVAHLVLGALPSQGIGALSPWLERRGNPIDEVIERLEAQQHRRFIKTHLALDSLPFCPQVKYVVVGRDARDVFMSLWNHHSNYQEGFLEWCNALPGRIGPPLPPAQDLHSFWRDWMTKGWFDWESEGYPYWGNLHHSRTWWAHRSRDNILFVHFNDLLADLKGEIRRVAGFLKVVCSEERLEAITQEVGFVAMKANAQRLLPGADEAWKGGAQTFLFKGSNGRWRVVLSPDELELYEKKAAELLTPDCRAWLEGQ
ncbi:MAG: sulfotransferase domain-containing protein [Deinococcota bacterium]|jgi:aryl sulfotransferase|nr:sulfotransferase domain-containing protein [Deinococcota bacterium]